MTVDTLGRAFGLYRRTTLSRSIVALLIANAIPLVGVVFFGWSLMTILVLYWVENGIVGLWNVPRIALAQGSVVTPLPDMPAAAALAATGDAFRAATLREAWRQAQASQAQQVAVRGSALRTLPGGGRIGLALFFLIHYGVFWSVHGIFVFALPTFGGFGSGLGSGLGSGGAPCFDGPLPSGGALGGALDAFSGIGACTGGAFGEILWGSVALGALALFLSHGASFLFNYIGRGEYHRQSPMRQMGAPYGRVVILHLTIIVGSLVVAFLGAPIGALLVLVILKSAFDLGLHLREHGPAPEPVPEVAAAS